MKRKSMLLVGSVFMLGTVDLNGETSFAENILNPLNPVEEITPKEAESHSEENSDIEVVEVQKQTEPAQEEKKPVEKKESEASSVEKDVLFKKNSAEEKFFVEDVFASQKVPAIALPPSTSGGGKDDPKDYCVQLYSLMSGLLLYGKKVEEETYHVYEVFR